MTGSFSPGGFARSALNPMRNPLWAGSRLGFTPLSAGLGGDFQLLRDRSRRAPGGLREGSRRALGGFRADLDGLRADSGLICL